MCYRLLKINCDAKILSTADAAMLLLKKETCINRNKKRQGSTIENRQHSVC